MAKTLQQIILTKLSLWQTLTLKSANEIFTDKKVEFMVNRFWIERHEIMGYLILLKILSISTLTIKSSKEMLKVLIKSI